MVQKRVVLFRVQHLQQRASGITVDASPDLVHLVDKNQWILRTHSFQGLDNLPRQSTDVRPPMTLDLRHIRQTTNGEPEELTIESACDRFADGGLSNTRRTSETDDLAFDGPAKLANSEEFEDTLFDIFEAVMVVIEYLGGVSDRVVLRRVLAPGYLNVDGQRRAAMRTNERRTWVSQSR